LVWQSYTLGESVCAAVQYCSTFVSVRRHFGYAQVPNYHQFKQFQFSVHTTGYFRGLGLERILRDAQAAQFHPMPAKKQHRFTGRLAMGLDPVSQ
jgi:hypothetical protein